MIRAGFVALIAALLPFSTLAQVNWSDGVIYEFDGSGNVRKIGTDTYLYDTAQRLIRGSVAGSQQSYTYDSFGNRKACQPAAGGDCQYGFKVDSTTNRIEGRTYDKRGNMLQLPEGNTIEYDELGLVRQENGSGRKVYYIYTTDDERIAVYEADTQLSTHRWEWTLRGLDKKPLREFTSEGSSGTASFKWSKDHVWRDGALLASRQADAGAPGGVSTYHYHVDHLGTPRQVTNSASVIVGRHDYLPFGPELTSTTIDEPKLQDLKFTGHERDKFRDRPALDYMHARYYEPRLGRFLSVDPTWESADLGKPQTWNRYAYVESNPINKIDPDGRCPACSSLPFQPSSEWVSGGTAYIVANYVLPDGDTPLFEPGYSLNADKPDLERAAASGAIVTAYQNAVDNLDKPGGPKTGSSGGPGEGKAFSRETKAASRAESGDRCVFCGTPTTRAPGPNQSNIDHSDPKSRGGNNTLRNAQNTCRTCNLKKAAKKTLEFLDGLIKGIR